MTAYNIKHFRLGRRKKFQNPNPCYYYRNIKVKQAVSPLNWSVIITLILVALIIIQFFVIYYLVEKSTIDVAYMVQLSSEHNKLVIKNSRLLDENCRLMVETTRHIIHNNSLINQLIRENDNSYKLLLDQRDYLKGGVVSHLFNSPITVTIVKTIAFVFGGCVLIVFSVDNVFSKIWP